jgi:hypothetical protein
VSASFELSDNAFIPIADAGMTDDRYAYTDDGSTRLRRVSIAVATVAGMIDIGCVVTGYYLSIGLCSHAFVHVCESEISV